jgi:hypothetical protein
MTDISVQARKGDTMVHGNHAGMPSKMRHGTCHRCGWSGAVVKIGRPERTLLKSGHSYGRLCGECIDDLVRTQSQVPVVQETEKPNLRAVAHLDVA